MNNIHGIVQSGFGPNNITETVLVKVIKDLLLGSNQVCDLFCLMTDPSVTKSRYA